MTTKEQLVDDIRRVASLLKRSVLTRSEYLSHGQFSEYQIYDGGDTWESLCARAGLTTRKVETVADDVYFARLRDAVAKLGRLPKANERKGFGLNFSKRRYPTLTEFYRVAGKLGVIDQALTGGGEYRTPEAIGTSRETQHDRATDEAAIRPVPAIPSHTRRKKWQRTGIDGFPYAPQDELGVVALFGVLCSKGLLNWSILELVGGKGIDAKCFDHASGSEIVVELKFLLTRASWNHKTDEIDCVVCWENRWKEFPKPVIELSKLLAREP